jgi:hypothetical protein
MRLPPGLLYRRGSRRPAAELHRAVGHLLGVLGAEGPRQKKRGDGRNGIARIDGQYILVGRQHRSESVDVEASDATAGGVAAFTADVAYDRIAGSVR